jgi:hypothetical protein
MQGGIDRFGAAVSLEEKQWNVIETVWPLLCSKVKRDRVAILCQYYRSITL